MTERDGAARIRAFIDAWPNFTFHGDQITSLTGHGYDGELLCSDLRAALEDRDRLRAALEDILTANESELRHIARAALEGRDGSIR